MAGSNGPGPEAARGGSSTSALAGGTPHTRVSGSSHIDLGQPVDMAKPGVRVQSTVGEAPARQADTSGFYGSVRTPSPVPVPCGAPLGYQ